MCAFLFVFPGDIGGQMGLFIGASILTILELFDYLYEVKISPIIIGSFSLTSSAINCLWKCVLLRYYLELRAHKMFFTQLYHPHRMCFGERDERCVPHNRAFHLCVTHTHLSSSNSEYIDILDELYFRLVRMSLSALIRVTLCCFLCAFPSTSNAERFFCVC